MWCSASSMSAMLARSSTSIGMCCPYMTKARAMFGDGLW
jgi:hypothetical protein